MKLHNTTARRGIKETIKSSQANAVMRMKKSQLAAEIFYTELTWFYTKIMVCLGLRDDSWHLSKVYCN